ncbi:flagellar hook-associated protein FlgL [Sporanaerobacter acetigenes]|uniref:flagellar hook-associated protein FlgL n=1 Tax=Sporanaerobacter acetigenes TaxID=165813 RepID=UPI001050FBC9|nr:flagellar hook-associated protein FlgL [Sporanaerobacter acetigenes]
MRITNNMLISNTLFNLNENLGRLEKLNQQMDTQKKFSVPSDDPIGASKSLKFYTDLSKIEQYKRNVKDATSWMTETESALIEIGEVLDRADKLAVQMANGTYSEDDLKKTKEEVAQLKEHLVQISNTTYAGRYIFSGYKTDKELLGKDGKYKIDLSNTEVVEYNVGVSEDIKVNTVGMRVFGVGTDDDNPGYNADSSDNTKESYLISVFDKFEKALNGEVDKGEIDKTLGRIKTCMDQVLSVRAEVGAKINRLNLTQKKLDSQVLSTKSLISYNEDADLAEVSIKLKTADNVYRASLAVGARIIQPSLVDFLR